MRDANHVLIAGAGPVGLVAANCLADAGVPVTVFEAEPRLPENLRASTFQPPTLDMLSRFGASQRLIEMGRIARRMQYREEWFFLLRVVGVWRAMFPTAAEEREADILSDDGIERRLQRVWPKSGRYEIVHRTLYPVHQRVAATYRKGRAFLAGDAAHLNNPPGGMGMNGGIHDAFSLAGTLARVARGEVDAAELDRYERQRRPVALEYVNTISSANKRNLESRDPEHQRRWREEMTRAAADPKLAREYLLSVSMIASLRKSEGVA